MPTPPFPAHLTRRAALGQALALAALFYAFVGASSLLGADATERLDRPLASVFVTGLLMLLPVVLFSVRDGGWRASLGVQRVPLLTAAGWGLFAVVLAYAANVVTTLVFLVVKGDLSAMLAQKAGWMQKLAELPAWLILPLAAFVGLWEELVFRGFLLGRVRASLPAGADVASQRRRDALAVAVSAVLFGAGHVYQGALGLAQTTAVGLVFGALVVWRRSLWPAVVAHLSIDAFGLFAIKVLKPLLGRLADGSSGQGLP